MGGRLTFWKDDKHSQECLPKKYHWRWKKLNSNSKTKNTCVDLRFIFSWGVEDLVVGVSSIATGTSHTQRRESLPQLLPKNMAFLSPVLRLRFRT